MLCMAHGNVSLGMGISFTFPQYPCLSRNLFPKNARYPGNVESQPHRCGFLISIPKD